MPKLTNISNRTDSDPENNKFINKTGPKRKQVKRYRIRIKKFVNAYKKSLNLTQILKKAVLES